MESRIKLPALGENVALGMLFDARTSTLYGGVSLWDNDKVNPELVTISPETVQKADFKMSYSLDETRKNAGLNVEGSLTLDLGLLKASGSAKYLSNNKTSTYEAHFNISCTILRRTRRIPQETLAEIKHGGPLENKLFTHFVAEVEEGGTATLTCTKKCNSETQTKEVEGKLKAVFEKIPISGEAGLTYTADDTSTLDNVQVEYSGAMVESVLTVEDAHRVAGEMPKKLAQQMNTLSYVLLPLSLLDNRTDQVIRELDAVLVTKTAAALRNGDEIRLKLEGLHQRAVNKGRFPVIQRQISRFLDVYATVSTQFKQTARRLLPVLRDGAKEEKQLMDELSNAVDLYERRTRVAREFVEKKHDEAAKLEATIEDLFDDGFEDYESQDVTLKSTPSKPSDVEDKKSTLPEPSDTMDKKSKKPGGIRHSKSLISKNARLMLSFGLNLEEHPLQKRLMLDQAPIESGNSLANDDSEDNNEEVIEEDLEWFDDDVKVEFISASCTKLRDLRTRLRSWGPTAPNVTFAVANVTKAFCPDRKKRVFTRTGDIVLISEGTTILVTKHLPGVLMEKEHPFVPTISDLTTNAMTVQIPWSLRDEKAMEVFPTISVLVKWCAVPNVDKDGVFPQVTANEIPKEVELLADEKVDSKRLSQLKSDCDYEIQICCQTAVGPTAWSTPKKVRTVKPPSVASKILEFYKDKSDKLVRRSDPEFKPWEMCDDTNALYLGHKVVSERKCNDKRFLDEVAVRIVDVAPQFRPDIKAAEITDEENIKIVVFVGATGHGKSTQINALVAYLLGNELKERRLMIIDDRGANQAQSVTKYITCYRIRPLSDTFKNKTLLIVDTPGYGDTGNESVMGYQRDQFVTVAMNVFFGTVQHVNSVVFTCRANETRKGTLDPVATYVFQLFAKNVLSCLRTIYTFSDVGIPQAKIPLEELGWPLKNGEVEVNNAAFHIKYSVDNAAKLLDWWMLSMKGQYRVLTTLMTMSPIPTNPSLQVTTHRMELEAKCTFVHMQIMNTVSDARNLMGSLDTLANALQAKPGEKVEVKTCSVIKVDVEKGKATTLCRNCHKTCHDVCMFIHDADKYRCAAMNGNHCTVCGCHWTAHVNTTFWLKAIESKKMVIPKEIIKNWNSRNNNIEGNLIQAMNEYMKLQKKMQEDIIYVSELSKKLAAEALHHNPEGLLNYVETLIQTALAQGLQPEYVVELKTAKNMLILEAEIKNNGAAGAMRVPAAVANVMNNLRVELERRMKIPAEKRLVEEQKECNLYNELRKLLPPYLQKKTSELKEKKSWITPPSALTYADNLVAIVGLVKLLLSDGSALAMESSNTATAA